MPPRHPKGQRLVFAGKTNQASFHVPARIARLVSPDARFRAELTDDGILFRYVSGQETGVRLPNWVVGDA